LLKKSEKVNDVLHILIENTGNPIPILDATSGTMLTPLLMARSRRPRDAAWNFSEFHQSFVCEWSPRAPLGRQPAIRTVSLLVEDDRVKHLCLRVIQKTFPDGFSCKGGPRTLAASCAQISGTRIHILRQEKKEMRTVDLMVRPRGRF
jgi:hypothetical protein